MRISKLCLDVIVFLLIALCEAKNEESKVESEYDYDNTENKDELSDINYGLGENTLLTKSWTYLTFAGQMLHSNITTKNSLPGESTPSYDDDEKNDSSVCKCSTNIPVFEVTTNGSNENNGTAVLLCDARSAPGVVTFFTWVHMWGDKVIRDGLTGRNYSHINMLVLKNLSLQDMGTYICFGTSQIERMETYIDSEILKITGLPTILLETSIFSRKLGQHIDVSIPFYSDPVIDTFYILVDGKILQNTSTISLYLVNDSIDYRMYGRWVRLEAHILHLVILNVSRNHLNNYTVVLTNSIGQKEFTFQLFLLENAERLSTSWSVLLVVGLVALLVTGTVVIIAVFLSHKSSQGKEPKDEKGLGAENIAFNLIYVVAGEGTGEQEYLGAKTSNDILCSKNPVENQLKEDKEL